MSTILLTANICKNTFYLYNSEPLKHRHRPSTTVRDHFFHWMNIYHTPDEYDTNIWEHSRPKRKKKTLRPQGSEWGGWHIRYIVSTNTIFTRFTTRYLEQSVVVRWSFRGTWSKRAYAEWHLQTNTWKDRKKKSRMLQVSLLFLCGVKTYTGCLSVPEVGFNRN